jgi:predicted ATPase
MSLRHIRLRNFRGFQDASLPLKPLTVLLGPNSAGKSSFGHALAALAHANREFVSGSVNLTPPQRRVEEWPVDLGATLDLRTRDASGRVQIGLTIDSGTIEFGFGDIPDTPDLLLSSLTHPSDEQSAHPVEMSTGEPTLPAPSANVSPLIRFDTVVDAPEHSIRLTRMNAVQWKDAAQETTVLLQGLILRAVRHTPGGTPRIVSVVAANELAGLFDTITYLRPNRAPPCRRYRDALGANQPIGYSGEYAVGLFHRLRDTTVSYARSDAWSITTATLETAVNEWLSHFRLADDLTAVALEPDEMSLRVRLKDQAPHDITEVGFGVSQIVPVVVAGLLQDPKGLLIVDLPEAHLHPRPQACVADFFCSLAMSGRSILVETHSEMFFHRLRLRAAQDPRVAEKIAVYFIDSPNKGVCTPPRLVPLDAHGPVQWPEGFMQEAWEIETQIQAAQTPRR